MQVPLADPRRCERWRERARLDGRGLARRDNGCPRELGCHMSPWAYLAIALAVLVVLVVLWVLILVAWSRHEPGSYWND